jgi:hypothetical protein
MTARARSPSRPGMYGSLAPSPVVVGPSRLAVSKERGSGRTAAPRLRMMLPADGLRGKARILPCLPAFSGENDNTRY